MGIMYYAVCDTTKQAVELGKKHYASLEDRSYETMDQLVAALATDFEEGSFDTMDGDSYVRWLAAQLWLAGNAFRLVDDSHQYLDGSFDGYTIVGSAYIPANDRQKVGRPLSEYLD